MRKFNIAYLMHGARNVGGGEYSIYFLIKNLRKDIFEPFIFYSYENEIIKKLREDGIKLIKIPLDEKITSVYRDEIRLNPFTLFSYACHLFSGIYQVKELLKANRIDLLHPHDNLSKIIGGLAAKISRIKVVVHCRDLLKENLIEKILIRYQLLIMDRIIAVSECNRSLFKIGRRVPKKVMTIYNGIDLKMFDSVKGDFQKKNLGIEDERFVIGIIGVFDKCKGHIYLFQAIEQLVSQGIKDIMCLVVGDGRERDELKGFVDNKRLQDYFKFLGYRKDIPKLLTMIDVVIMPSIQESFPRVPLEAMAMKIPVIATTVGGLPESIEDGKTGILVPPEDVGSLEKAIKYLIENQVVRENMGEEGKKRVEKKFSLENNVSRTEELYLDVLRKVK